MIHLVVCRADVSDTATFHSGASSATEDLQNIQDREVGESTLGAIVYLSPLDNDCGRSKDDKQQKSDGHTGVCGQIDTPCQGRGAAEDLTVKLLNIVNL